ncbi:MAG: cytochrome c biogenesis protein CcdA [Planctomycetota bacterium]
MKRLFSLLLTVVLTASACGQGLGDNFFGDVGADFQQSARLEARLVPSHESARPGDTLHVAVDMRIAETWVYYGPEPGTDAAFVIPARMEVSAGPLKAGEPLWPEAEPYEYDLGDRVITVNSFKDRAIAYVPLEVPEGVEPGEYTVEVTLAGQVCGGPDDVCINLEGDRTVSAETTVRVDETTEPNPAWSDDPRISDGLEKAEPAGRRTSPGAAAGDDMTIWTGLALAVLAGLILNIMPCVLPIIPLRIYSLVQMGGQSRRRYVTLGLAFAAGMMLFFIALAVANLVLKLALDRAFNWSQQWQSQPIRVGMSLVLVVVAANLFDLFTVTVPQKVAALEGRPGSGGHVSSAGMGLMMAILATPCSFGILLAALAWGQTQTLAIGTAVFLMIGLGMALPHVALAAFPKLLNRLPKPGRWMELMKHGMGFLLLLVAIWLVSTLAENSYPFWVVAYAVVLAMALWTWGKWVRYDSPLRAKLLVRGIAVVLAVAAGWWMLSPPKPLTVDFAPFNEAAIERARENGRPVVLKFTASWCVSCVWIDNTVYRDEELTEQLQRRDVLTMVADVTDADAPAATYLRDRFGKAPPLTVVFPPGDGEPVELTGKYDKDDLLEALDEVSSPR